MDGDERARAGEAFLGLRGADEVPVLLDPRDALSTALRGVREIRERGTFDSAEGIPGMSELTDSVGGEEPR